jgi:uncharacterized protein
MGQQDLPLVHRMNRGTRNQSSDDRRKMMSESGSRVVNERNGALVGTSVGQANGAWRSFKGLMLMKRLPDGHGLVFRPARGIHTHFMRFPIDLVFLDAASRVTKTRECMVPWRFDFTTADAVIELNAGTIRNADVRFGDRLVFETSGG